MTPPAKVVADAVRMRRRVQELLTRTAKPSQQMDLYLLLGELCGLLAVASFDLGDSQAATSHARAAWGTGSTSTMTGRACDRADLADHVDPTRRARRHGFTVLTALVRRFIRSPG